ncbi:MULTISPECIES: crossover junction endodeoxyribonuclease RuvC [Psychrilyobacter]|nr:MULTISPECIES: crossover junction endodeoxyribonuclease RuvC [Psychrilyobacter]NDI77315.1 crossover junction endodeoxyribonuclease RuvC [Psychrilyobacter piezotolerans]
MYVTKSGKKYHRESCRYNKNTTAMSVGEARGIGLEACMVCKPY